MKKQLRPDAPLYACRGVLSADVGDGVVLLSLRANAYYTFRGVGRDIWRGVEGHQTPAAIANTLHSKFSKTDAGRIDTDVSAALQEMSARRLVQDSPGTSAPQARPKAASRSGPPSASRVFTSLASISIAVRILGLPNVLQRIYRYDARQTEKPSWLGAAVRRVAIVAALHPLKPECLQRSLCLLWMLRRRGVAAVLRVGVTTHPFAAHAWVELNGQPINETPDYLAVYRMFPPIGAKEVF